MHEVNLKSWETLPDNIKKFLPFVYSKEAAPLPETPETSKFYRVYPENCLAGDGSQYHGLVRIGRQPDKLIIFFNGGGVSWNTYTAARPNSFFTQHIEDRYYFNNTHYMADYSILGGIASDRPDNPFADWSMVQIPYATGDFHCGTGELPYTAVDGTAEVLPHHGYINTMALLNKVKALLGQPKTLLICGASAGAFGVSLMADDVISVFPSCENIVTCVDSAVLLSKEWPQIARNVWKAPEHICSRLTGDHLMLDSYSALYRKYGDRIRYLFICSVKDALLTEGQNALDGKGMRADRESGHHFYQILQETCREMIRKIPKVSIYLFDAPMGDEKYDREGLTKHCLIDNPMMFDYQYDGITAAQWVFGAFCAEPKHVGRALW